MQHIAQIHHCVVVGSAMIVEEGKYYNRLFAVDAANILAQYDKKHLFRMAKEHEAYTAGAAKEIFEIKGYKVLPLICYDLRFPVWSRNQIQEMGDLAYDILLYVANWPQRRVSHWDILLKARAIENQSFVIGVNRVFSRKSYRCPS
jgi:predicted amidohydrolase